MSQQQATTPPMDSNAVKSFMQLVSAQEEKTRISVMLELLRASNLEFITEYPNFTYTKAMTKYETWRTSVMQTFNLNEDDTDTICVQAMETAFMKKNVSHKRRRSHELVNALRGEDVSNNVLDHEHKGLRRFLGLR